MNIKEINLKTLTNEELETLITDAREELNSRTRNISTELVLYTHDCKDSARSHKVKYKHWSKLVTGVDTTKTNGYAFQGEFLNFNAQHKLPVGSIVVEVCENDITAYEIIKDGYKNLGEEKTNSMSKFIDKLAKRFI